ncbi:hypothetical protein LS73_006885 [Helicobacter muridarum]|uniref:Outer membrane beta-barrel protein n=1 Tax=Helicobacter muridarum TaxID=216 RepID=A0A377PVS0_9HELI|nr:hypothetical protein [Helicobacter muridarum]TLD99790.1 hypothetical protein LS73_006885 [Helicobacter muridarum]STQ86976.1 Uncharacterised protein [Helicobacter muridarum]
MYCTYSKYCFQVFKYILIVMFLCPLFLRADSNVPNLELAGSESFEYDVNNKIRKAKSNFNIGIGANISKVNHESLGKYRINVSALLGYSQFFYKTFGVRLYGLFDYSIEKIYGGAGFDVLWDFLQTENFGIGIISGSSVGYSQVTELDNNGGALSQFHVGASVNFDGGKSRLEGLVRIPYNKLKSSNTLIDVGITYVIMYSYLF